MDSSPCTSRLARKGYYCRSSGDTRLRSSGRGRRQRVVLTPGSGTCQPPAPEFFPGVRGGGLVCYEEPKRGSGGGKVLPASSGRRTREERRSLQVFAGQSKGFSVRQLGVRVWAGLRERPAPSREGRPSAPAAAQCGRDGPVGAEVTLPGVVAAAEAAVGGGVGVRGEPVGGGRAAAAARPTGCRAGRRTLPGAVSTAAASAGAVRGGRENSGRERAGGRVREETRLVRGALSGWGLW